MIGEASGESPVTVYSRALGVRDAAIGVGVLTAADSEKLRPWILAGIVSDVVDFAATLEARTTCRRWAATRCRSSRAVRPSSGAWLLTQLD